jgi:hypothetical protein
MCQVHRQLSGHIRASVHHLNLEIIKQKPDESLRDYVKSFCTAKNAIPNIQDIEIINAFRDGVTDIKIVEEITMKKLKTVADLLAVADV